MAPPTDRLDASNVQMLSLDRVATRVYRAGAGPSLLMIGGGQPGNLYSLDQWSLNLPWLERSFDVIAYDKLGQGHTDNPPDPSGYTFDAVLAHGQRLIEELDLRDARVVGHSRGGLLACLLARRFPERISSVVIVDSGSTADHESNVSDVEVYRELGLLDGWAAGEDPTIENVGVEPLGQAYDASQVSDDFLHRLLEIAKLPKMSDARDVMEGSAGRSWYESVDRARRENLDFLRRTGLSQPCLMIWGADDRTAPLKSGLSLFEDMRERNLVELHVLNRAGHYSFRDRAPSFNRAVTSFCL